MKTIKNVVAITLLCFTTLIFSVTLYIKRNFANQSIDEIIFTVTNGIKGTSPEVVVSAISQSIIPFLIVFTVLFLPTTNFLLKLQKSHYFFEIFIRKKKFIIDLHPLSMLSQFKITYSAITLIIVFTLCFQILGIDQYIKRLSEYSTIFEDYYVDGREINIEFPESKRNLIILYLESMENTMMDKESGGGWEYNVIPELTLLAEHNINFSNTDKIGGALPLTGTQWTIAAMVSSTSGVPLKIPIEENSYNDSENFLPGVYTLGDILKKEGYKLGLMVGSDAKFGGRRNYYTSHGNYEIFDLYRAIDEGRMTPEEKVWWGFDDSDLFTWAKEEILNYSEQEAPFSFTLLTVNTHFPHGYLENETDTPFETQYENVHAHSSKQVMEFVDWLKQQDFYKDTTLVIVGDHLSMQKGGYFVSRLDENYTRTQYNAFINPVVQPVNTKNRMFTNLDLYPTILASIGVRIEGERLGLGTNLFSEKPTLPEEIGFDYFEEELSKNSLFYNQNVLQDDFLKLMEKTKDDK